MTAYRLYCFDGAGRIESADLIEAEDDAEALTLALAMNKSICCEVWEKNRLVARLPAFRARA